MNDQLIKERIESLDTLSGGIVFGREEAWDKLQTRMDAGKKTFRLSWVYWQAAAIVLLAIGIALFYRQPAEQVAVSVPEQQKNTAPTSPKNLSAPMPAAEKDNVSVTHATTNNTTQHQVSALAVTLVQQEPEKTTPITDNSAEQLPAPQAITMPVVYIGDAEKDKATPAAVDKGVAVQSPTIADMPVHYINDVIRDENNIRAIMKENRMTTGRLFFRRQNSDIECQPATTDQYEETQPFLKRIFNPQN